MGPEYFQQAVRDARSILRLARYMDKEEFGLPGVVDEVSLLFATSEELSEFKEWARQARLINFARVPRDLVQCQGADWWENWHSEEPIDESFAVRFEFFRFPLADWRIEAMCVLAGTAPLHEAWLERFGSGCVVHASYKTPTEATFATHTPRSSLRASQPTHRASYANSYGRFSYYQHPWFGYHGIEYLLKPRVNLRDTAQLRP